MSELADDLRALADELNDGAPFPAANISRLRAAADELDRLAGLVNPNLKVRDLEMKLRSGEVIGDIVWEDGNSTAMKLLAALMLHWLLAADGEMPPNYRVSELTVQPAWESKYRVVMEVVKPDGKSSHELRRALEAERDAAYERGFRDGAEAAGGRK